MEGEKEKHQLQNEGEGEEEEVEALTREQPGAPRSEGRACQRGDREAEERVTMSDL